jgi:hypothetical protein
MTKVKIRNIVKKLKTGDGIEVHWVDASDDDGDLTKFTWYRRTDVLNDTTLTKIRTRCSFLQVKRETLFIYCNDEIEPDAQDPQIALRGQIPMGCIIGLWKTQRIKEGSTEWNT